MKILEYETANPGQDATLEGAGEKLPETDISMATAPAPAPTQPNIQHGDGNVGSSS